ncbi:hypothetical protein L218DRAFT_236346 [Marasmius fiardii PR-910]|nr:hypothetical protein L218DRAFT_236346 [Marasmius fiardii PR-910]
MRLIILDHQRYWTSLLRAAKKGTIPDSSVSMVVVKVYFKKEIFLFDVSPLITYEELASRICETIYLYRIEGDVHSILIDCGNEKLGLLSVGLLRRMEVLGGFWKRSVRRERWLYYMCRTVVNLNLGLLNSESHFSLQLELALHSPMLARIPSLVSRREVDRDGGV